MVDTMAGQQGAGTWGKTLMAGPVPVDWLPCDEDGCIGIRLDAGDKCLAHAGDEERDAVLKPVAQTGKIDASTSCDWKPTSPSSPRPRGWVGNNGR